AELSSLFAFAGVTHPRRRSPTSSRARTRLDDHEVACGRLLGVCDRSDVGRRDELVLRLRLAGMRVAEILRLTVGDVHRAEGTIMWIGKTCPPQVLEVMLVPRSLQQVIDQADELAKRFEGYEPSPASATAPHPAGGRSSQASVAARSTARAFSAL
ncbi:MAG TPA: hypothetical protein VFP61_15445, partial [Acidimicrobiales bacterium]|nr:hypothetical protein [Acidimicrobiales bacterium]